jgi:hypothetical protein
LHKKKKKLKPRPGRNNAKIYMYDQQLQFIFGIFDSTQYVSKNSNTEILHIQLLYMNNEYMI